MPRKKKDADSSEPQGFPKKWLAKLGNFPELAESFDNDTIKRKVIELEQAISTTEKDKEADSELAALKEQYKSAAEVYTQSIGECQAQIKYLVFMLESRGQG